MTALNVALVLGGPFVVVFGVAVIVRASVRSHAAGDGGELARVGQVAVCAAERDAAAYARSGRTVR